MQRSHLGPVRVSQPGQVGSPVILIAHSQSAGPGGGDDPAQADIGVMDQTVRMGRIHDPPGPVIGQGLGQSRTGPGDQPVQIVVPIGDGLPGPGGSGGQTQISMDVFKPAAKIQVLEKAPDPFSGFMAVPTQGIGHVGQCPIRLL